MSQREEKWERLLSNSPISSEIQRWLNSDSNRPFQITSSDFRSIGAKPVRLIPTYSSDEVPSALRRRGLEQIRNLKGGCVLIKVEGKQTLFPSLPKLEEINLQTPPQRLNSLKLLDNLDLHNEETGIVLAKELGIYTDFFKRFDRKDHNLVLGGRIKTVVSGEYSIDGYSVPVDEALLEIDNFLECNHYLVPIEAKIQSKALERTSFSIHQFALPTLLLSQKSEKRILSCFQIYKLQIGGSIQFRIFLFELQHGRGVVYPHSYNFLFGLKYNIKRWN